MGWIRKPAHDWAEGESRHSQAPSAVAEGHKPQLIALDVEFSARMAPQAPGKRSWPVRALPFCEEVLDERVIEENWWAACCGPECVAFGAGAGSGHQKNELPVGIARQSDRDLGERTPMLRMAIQAEPVLANEIQMELAKVRSLGGGELLSRVATQALLGAHPVERLMTRHALRNVRMVATQLAWRPQRFWVAHRAPPDPDQQDQRAGRHGRHDG